MSQEIELYQKVGNPIEAAERMGVMFAKSGLFGVEKTETGQVLALACLAEGKSPFEIVRTYHIVEGKLAMRADAMLAQFRHIGGRVRWKQFDDKAAIGLWSLDGTEIEIGFTMEDAKRMEVIRPRSGWIKAPDAMLRARCIAKAIRMICPEVIAGYLSVEEIVDDSDGSPQPAIVLSSDAPPVRRGRPPKTEPVIVVTPAPLSETQKTQLENPSLKTDETKPITDPVPAVEKPTPPANGPLTAKPGPDGKGISTETIAGLMGIIGEHETNAVSWLMNKRWITDNNIATITPQNAQKIFSHKEAFLKEMGRMKAAV